MLTKCCRRAHPFGMHTGIQASIWSLFQFQISAMSQANNSRLGVKPHVTGKSNGMRPIRPVVTSLFTEKNYMKLQGVKSERAAFAALAG